MKWLEIAWAEVGVQETSGGDATPTIVGYFRDAGRPEITSDEVAWCAAFVAACLERAGIPQTIPPAEALLARSYLRVGTEIPEPRMGCLVILSRGSDPRAGHVGFCVGWTDTEIVLLGGNQGNKVSTQHFSRGRILPGGLRWPGPAVAPKDLGGSRIVQRSTRLKKDGAKTIGVEAVPDDAVAAAGDYIAPAAAPAAPPVADPLALPDKFPSPDDIVSNASWLQSTVESVASFGSFAAHKWPWIAGALTLYWLGRIVWDGFGISRARAEDASTGKTT